MWVEIIYKLTICLNDQLDTFVKLYRNWRRQDPPRGWWPLSWHWREPGNLERVALTLAPHMSVLHPHMYIFHLLHTCEYSTHMYISAGQPEHTPSFHCPNWVPLWPVLNLKPFSGDIIAQDLFVSLMTHKLWHELESACMAIGLHVLFTTLSFHISPNSPIFFNGFVFIRFSAIL